MKMLDSRVIITDRNDQGKSYVGKVEKPQPIELDAARIAQLWASPDPSSPFSDEAPTGGNRFILMEMDPSGSSEGWLHANMHTSKTLNYVVILSGRAVLKLEEGEIELGPGDVLVHRALGTKHAWHIPGPDKCYLMSVMVCPNNTNEGRQS